MTSQNEVSDALLAVEQLPNRIARLAKGSVYGILTEDFGARSAITLGTLALNARSIPTVLITDQSPSAIVRRMNAWGIDANRQLETGALMVFSKLSQWGTKVLQHGPDRFLRELEYFGVSRHRLILIDHADDLFSARDMEVAVHQARVYHDWVADNGHVLMALFARRGTDALSTAILRAASESFAGFAAIEMNGSKGALRIEHWFSAQGGATAHAIPVALGSDGLLRAEGHAGTATSDGVTSTESASAMAVNALVQQSDILTTVRAFIALGRPQGAWTVVDDFDGALAAARDKRFGVAVLHYDAQTDFAVLARAVSTLRAQGGAHLGIAIRECGRRLRFSNELALIKLGVNLVMHSAMPLREVELALEAMRGQTFSKPIELDADEALRSIALLEHSGLVRPNIFARLAADVLERSQHVGAPNVLAVLKRADGASAQEAVRATRARRLGDFFAYDGSYCYAFLSGCNGADAVGALEAMFDHEIRRHFVAIELNDTTDAARAALERIAERNRPQNEVEARKSPTAIERAALAGDAGKLRPIDGGRSEGGRSGGGGLKVIGEEHLFPAANPAQP